MVKPFVIGYWIVCPLPIPLSVIRKRSKGQQPATILIFQQVHIFRGVDEPADNMPQTIRERIQEQGKFFRYYAKHDNSEIQILRK